MARSRASTLEDGSSHSWISNTMSSDIPASSTLLGSQRTRGGPVAPETHGRRRAPTRQTWLQKPGLSAAPAIDAWGDLRNPFARSRVQLRWPGGTDLEPVSRPSRLRARTASSQGFFLMAVTAGPSRRGVPCGVGCTRGVLLRTDGPSRLATIRLPGSLVVASPELCLPFGPWLEPTVGVGSRPLAWRLPGRAAAPPSSVSAFREGATRGASVRIRPTILAFSGGAGYAPSAATPC